MLEKLERDWRFRSARSPVNFNMRFGPDGLVLGADTVLAPADEGGAILLDEQDDRLLTLLAAAYGSDRAIKAIGHVRRATECWSDGEVARAELHLSLTGLPKLGKADHGAKRLFLAEALLESGVSPADIVKALNAEPLSNDQARKFYNPDEDRNPKGDGTQSGEWTASPDSGVQTETFLEHLTQSQALRLALAVARVAGPWAALGTVFIPTNKSLRVEGKMPGYPGMSYLWYSDSTRLLLNYREPDGGLQIAAAQLDGKFFRDPKGRVVGRILPNNTLAIDPAAAFFFDQKDRPRLCPKPEPDIGHGSKKADLDFEDYIKVQFNPGEPTPRGYGAQLPNPAARTGLQFYDDCQRTTGILAEMKRGYTGLLLWQIAAGRFDLAKQWLAQSGQQLAASQGRPITWFCSERLPAAYVRTLFALADQGRERIRIVYTPWRATRK